jgi:hypothetical protein
MKRLFTACLGFSLLCLALSCGQQALRRDAQAAQANASTVWVHAMAVEIAGTGKTQPRPDEAKGLLNLSHVTFIGTVSGVPNIAIVPHSYSHNGGGDVDYYQVDAGDVPK